MRRWKAEGPGGPQVSGPNHGVIPASTLKTEPRVNQLGGGDEYNFGLWKLRRLWKTILYLALMLRGE
jgi:hypothetical protein